MRARLPACLPSCLGGRERGRAPAEEPDARPNDPPPLLLLLPATPPTPTTCPPPAPPPLLGARRPYWGSFRTFQVYRRALPGLNSSAVGLIVSSVFQLTLTAYGDSPFPTASICIGILAFGATDILAVPAPAVVVGGGTLGVIAHYTGMY